MHFLVRMQQIILTKNEELFFKYTPGTIYFAEPRWDTTFQTWLYHFTNRTALQKGNKSIFQKGLLLVTTEYFISLHAQFVALPPDYYRPLQQKRDTIQP